MLPIGHPTQGLPIPDADALEHSRLVAAHIRAAIRDAGGALPFARYMELVLYAPGLGYYSAGSRKFGTAGDFVTAPEISPLFSRCVARQCAEVLMALGGGSILELGAGSGVMAADMLSELRQLGQLPEEYLILEVSADLKIRQRDRLAARVPELLPQVRWLDGLPERFEGVIVGNEVLDALPVVRFRKGSKGYEEYCVVEKGESFAWTLGVPRTQVTSALVALENNLKAPLAHGYTSEICTVLPALFKSFAVALKRGAILFLDYGYPQAAFYHPERHMGTFMCHYRQRAHGNPFLYPGLQDITAHVDFSAVAEAGTEAGLELTGYTTQAHFLLALGIGEEAMASLQVSQQVKLLTLPDEMGERFKAIGFSKDLERTLGGFGLRDLAHTL